MCISAYYAHQNAEELKKKGIFKKAKEKFQIAFELYDESGMHAPAIDCLIQKTVCIIESYLQDSTFSQESEANNILQPYLSSFQY